MTLATRTLWRVVMKARRSYVTPDSGGSFTDLTRGFPMKKRKRQVTLACRSLATAPNRAKMEITRGPSVEAVFVSCKRKATVLHAP